MTSRAASPPFTLVLRYPVPSSSPYAETALLADAEFIALCEAASARDVRTIIVAPTDAKGAARRAARRHFGERARNLIHPVDASIGTIVALVCIVGTMAGQAMPFVFSPPGKDGPSPETTLELAERAARVASAETVIAAAVTEHAGDGRPGYVVPGGIAPDHSVPMSDAAAVADGAAGSVLAPVGLLALPPPLTLQMLRAQERIAMKALSAAVAIGDDAAGLCEPDVDVAGLAGPIDLDTLLRRTPEHVRLVPGGSAFGEVELPPRTLTGEPVRRRSSSPRRAEPLRRTAIVRRASQRGGCLWRLPQGEAPRPTA